VSEEERQFCTAHSEKLDHMLGAQSQHGTDIQWLIKLSARVLTVAGTALLLALTAGVPMVWGIYREHTEMKARIEALDLADKVTIGNATK
jgi:hypothetical protein